MHIKQLYKNTSTKLYIYISRSLSWTLEKFTSVNILLCRFNVLQSCHGLAHYCIFRLSLIFSMPCSLAGRRWLYWVSVFAVISERRPVIRRKHAGFPLDPAAFGVGTAATGCGPCDIGFTNRAVMDPRMDAVVQYRTEAGVAASRATLRSCSVLPKKR